MEDFLAGHKISLERDDTELKLTALEFAESVCVGKAELLETAKLIYEWLKGGGDEQ